MPILLRDQVYRKWTIPQKWLFGTAISLQEPGPL